MKKRLLIIISFLMIAAVLTACGGKPKGISQEVYEIGCDALNIMEKYNNAEIGKDEAKERLSAIRSRLSEVQDSNDVNENLNKGIIESDIFLFNASLDFNDGGTYEHEKSLRERLGK